jgi:threonine/homoserine/homoserine lactone efflux protein
MSMTLAASDLALYAVAVLILFLTPGPVWVALLARAMSGGVSGRLASRLGSCYWGCCLADPCDFRCELGGQ